MKFQMVSDLHLDHLDSDEFHLLLEPCAPVLILAGDIATHRCEWLPLFLEWVSQRYEVVLWILGNHEYYDVRGYSHDELQKILRRKCPVNVHILDNETYIYEDVAIIGSTLWSYVPIEQEEVVRAIETKVTSYRFIWTTGSTSALHCGPPRRITVEDTNQWHREAIDFLREEIEKYRYHKKLVVTHFAPWIEGMSHPRYDGDILHCAFATDVIPQLGHAVPMIWCSGHTHYNVDRIVENTSSSDGVKVPVRLISNQYGYEGDHEGRPYRWDHAYVL